MSNTPDLQAVGSITIFVSEVNHLAKGREGSDERIERVVQTLTTINERIQDKENGDIYKGMYKEITKYENKINELKKRLAGKTDKLTDEFEKFMKTMRSPQVQAPNPQLAEKVKPAQKPIPSPVQKLNPNQAEVKRRREQKSELAAEKEKVRYKSELKDWSFLVDLELDKFINNMSKSDLSNDEVIENLREIKLISSNLLKSKKIEVFEKINEYREAIKAKVTSENVSKDILFKLDDLLKFFEK